MKWDWLKSLSRKLSASIQEIINYSINYPLCASWEFLWCSLSSISYHIFNITKWFWCLPQNGSAAMRLIAILKSCLHPISHPVTSAGDDIMYHSALTPSVFGKWEVQKNVKARLRSCLNPWLLASCDNSQIQSLYDMVRSAKSIIYLTEWHIGLKF